MEFRKCRKCGEEKDIEEYSFHGVHENPKYSHYRIWTCKSCVAAYARMRRATKKEQYKNQSLNRNYGLSLNTFKTILEQQGNGCAICERKDPGKLGWAVDHDHKTGQVRGILCGKCNSILGMSGDNISILESAIGYLSNTMKIRIVISEDSGEEIWEYEGNLNIPKDLKTPPERPFIDRKTGTAVYGFTYQPIVKTIPKGE